MRLIVDKLARRRRVSNDHWPWVISFFTPRHENYPLFQSALVFAPDGKEVPVQVSLIAISKRVEVYAQAKSKSASSASESAAAQEVTTGPSADNSQSRKKPSATVVTLEAAPVQKAETAAAQQTTATFASSENSLNLPTGTQAKVVLLGGVSASKSRPGDAFQARVIEPVRQGSKVVLPAGSILAGQVVKSTPPRWLSRAGSLYLRFTGLTVPGGGGGAIVASPSAAELEQGSRSRMDSEGAMKGDHPGKAWMLIHTGVTAGIAKVADDGTQLLIEGLISTATDASTAGTAKVVAACASAIFLVTRHGRDVILPRFTEMDIMFDRPVSVDSPPPASTKQKP